MHFRYVGIGIVLAATVACVWYGRAAVLRTTASLWIVSDPVRPADAIVVLGGNLHVRPGAAAEMYRRGLAEKVLVSQTPVRGPVSADRPSHAELTRDALMKLGVPAESIEFFGTGSRNTREEAVALRRWVERNSSSTLIVPTDIFSSRRVRWILRHEISSSNIAITVPAFEPPYYSRDDWWRSRAGVSTFRNEVMKYIYYRIKY